MNSHHRKKNLMRSTTDKPLRFALLGPHKSSKSSIVSIITNDKSLGNYYPTLRNSPTLIQFQPKNSKTRALLDVNLTLSNLEEMDLLNSNNLVLTDRILSIVSKHSSSNNNNNSLTPQKSNNNNPNHLNRQSPKHISSVSMSLSMTSPSQNLQLSPTSSNTTIATTTTANTTTTTTTTSDILSSTLNYYDLDYDSSLLFDDNLSTNSFSYSSFGDHSSSLSPIQNFYSPLTHNTNHAGFSNGKGSYFSSVMSAAAAANTSRSISGSAIGSKLRNHQLENNLNITYSPPVTTPILLELIDTPGVIEDDLIPFLERSLDCKLSSDVLRNLTNDLDGADISGNRARVKPLIVGSGISDLNSSVDGYFLCYSCIPETSMDSQPPAYDDDIIQKKDNNNNSEYNESLKILIALKSAITEAWREYSVYHESWNNGKEHDVFSFNHSIKNLWKKDKDKNQSYGNDNNNSFISKDSFYTPPMIIIATHSDHELASPLLIEQGRELAKSWNIGFVECSCAFEEWENVEESIGFMIRETIEAKKEMMKKSYLNSKKK
ncbi:hypothetical protein CANARDRAFT_28859 [[Candida] arabinofermentans NRRL YB-2248]|uniref:Uncharacterized protein n=1 Tax=[Candida] arabinofermentans NRRL YB-2248 TaxID=983967 RepID=A0A1E4SZ06_9ASCO|nr:hypothetical protein CANARDRAFT_28859 [[Candida] arabinofermentans NRRL YB-2248]